MPHRTRPCSNAGPSRGRPGPALAAESAGVVGQAPLVDLEAIPIDVAAVQARHDELPFRPGHPNDARAARRQVARARPAVYERSGITRIMQDLQNAGMSRRCPAEFTLVGPGMEPARERNSLLLKEPYRLHGAASSLEGIEDQPDCSLHLGVGIEVDCSASPVDETDRRPHFELAAPCLVELAAAHACLEDVQFGLAHGALEPEQQPVIEAGRIVRSVMLVPSFARARCEVEVIHLA